jgi:hypothetical protein
MDRHWELLCLLLVIIAFSTCCFTVRFRSIKLDNASVVLFDGLGLSFGLVLLLLLLFPLSAAIFGLLHDNGIFGILRNDVVISCAA